MITEDYVSFETAKLLKEKGFPQEYNIYHSLVYNEEDYIDEYEIQRMVLGTRLIKAGTLSSYPVGVPEPKCYCPTLQMAMKWLREVYHLSIDVYVTKGPTWCASIKLYDTFGNSTKQPYNDWDKTYSYEEAVEAAIKYCLENLI